MRVVLTVEAAEFVKRLADVSRLVSLGKTLEFFLAEEAEGWGDLLRHGSTS